MKWHQWQTHPGLVIYRWEQWKAIHAGPWVECPHFLTYVGPRELQLSYKYFCFKESTHEYFSQILYSLLPFLKTLWVDHDPKSRAWVVLILRILPTKPSVIQNKRAKAFKAGNIYLRKDSMRMRGSKWKLILSEKW